MDFGRPLLEEESVATRSNIRILPSSQQEPLSLDDRLIRAANQAAIDLFGTPNPFAGDYTERILPKSPTIQEGDLVVIFESFDNLNFVYATPNATFTNKNGQFSHNSFLGKPWGCKIRSTSHAGYGYCYLLKPRPELWVRSLPHRTQVIHELDASMIIHQLWLRPNMIVVESGTGSGALSHSLVRTLAPHGHLHTFEFHKERAQTAQQEFQNHNMSHLVTVHHCDVCADGFVGLPADTAHAVSLDLPEPWLAVPHASLVIKRGGRLCSYSPCVEQSQRTIAALQEHGFHSIKTMEFRLREYHVDSVPLEAPPSAKRPRPTKEEYESSIAAATEEPKLAASPQEDKSDDKTASTAVAAGALTKDDADGKANEEEEEDSKKRKRSLCARPFALMRGHTAFLTFATAGTKPKVQKK